MSSSRHESEKDMGAALLEGLLTSSFAGLWADRLLGLLLPCTGKETWMGSLIEELRRREAAA
jgi:hypothetical protein